VEFLGQSLATVALSDEAVEVCGAVDEVGE
jgi:hypothetical protein